MGAGRLRRTKRSQRSRRTRYAQRPDFARLGRHLPRHAAVCPRAAGIRTELTLR